MTAEVAVLNCTGVALAADSAVTVGSQKIYNSAVKLFALSKVAPVAIMVYGNAALSGVPWEIIIKEYRRRIGAVQLPALEDYVSGFVEFIQASPVLFNDQGDQLWLYQRTDQILGEVQKACLTQLQERLTEVDGVGLDEDEVVSIFKQVASECLKNIKGWPVLDVPKDVMERVKPWIRHIVGGIARARFGDLSVPLSRTLNQIALQAFGRMIFQGPSSGIVIAGYGEDEIYPSIKTLEFDGAVRGFARFTINENRTKKITPGGNTASIIAYAQEDMVATFMEGMNPAVGQFIDTSLTQIFAALPDALLSGLGVEDVQLRDALSEICTNIKNGFLESAGRHRFAEHVSPILDMVTALPKDELAGMAESLVNLTAFKRRVTGTLETVGGPIDVCVISKGDGLVWVKRKHYFPADLNVMFHQNYMRDIQSGSP
ncbi:hypothetical protein I5U59_03170 [Stenotrophomonas maltophilia]|nr:hypothetical protein [Stenotrophomonas maltophilia]MBH1502073.1 hypothetical protein [Stenotrophomonas maltophilia]